MAEEQESPIMLEEGSNFWRKWAYAAWPFLLLPHNTQSKAGLQGWNQGHCRRTNLHQQPPSEHLRAGGQKGGQEMLLLPMSGQILPSAPQREGA